MHQIYNVNTGIKRKGKKYGGQLSGDRELPHGKNAGGNRPSQISLHK
jgi:hypothetical protein